MKPDTDKSLGQIAWEAYAESAGFKSSLGNFLQDWIELNAGERWNWNAAAKAVEEEVKTSESVPHET